MTSAMPEKDFAVVEFEDGEGPKVIPSKWIIDDYSATYPIKCSDEVLKELVKNCADVKTSWALLTMKSLYYTTNSFSKAEKMLALAKHASDAESDASETGLSAEKIVGRRQRRVPSRYITEENPSKKSSTPKAGKSPNLKIKKTKDISDVQSDSSDSNNFSFPSRKRKTPSYYADEKALARKSITSRSDSLEYLQAMLGRGVDSSEEEDYISNALNQKKRKATDMSSRFNHEAMDDLSSDDEYAKKIFQKKILKSPAMLSSLHKLKRNSDLYELKQLMIQILNVQEKCYLKLKALDVRQKQLRTEMGKMRNGILQPSEKVVETSNIQDFVNLPIYTDEELEDLNEKLTLDREFQSRFAQFLYQSCYGKTIATFMTSCLRKIMSQNVAQLYSRLGRKGKKSFISLGNLYSTMIAAASTKFPEAKPEELSDKLGKALASSGDWDGRKPPFTITVVKQHTDEDENC